MDTYDFTVRQSKLSLVLFIIGAILFLILFLCAILPAAVKSEDGFVVLIFLPIVLVSPFRIFLWYRYKIIVNGDQITATPYFGRTKTFNFDYITKVKQGSITMVMSEETVEIIKAYHENEKIFTATANCQKYYDLVSYLGDKGVPFERKSKN